MNVPEESINTIELAAEITIAWLSNPSTRATPGDVSSFIGTIDAALKGLTAVQSAPVDAQTAATFEPATTVRKSLASDDYIVSMIDGKPYKMLGRHLSANGLTPATYRERYGLRPDYPMVSVNYSAARRAMALKIGLGRKTK